jgi:transposase
MWALRKKEAALTEGEKITLDKLFTHSPLLKEAYVFRDELTALFDQDLTRAQAKRRLTGWMARVKRSAIRCFDQVMKTFKTRIDEMTNYFVERHTSGFVEGLNNKIKVIKRRCYGILNTGHLFQHIYLDLFGYSLYGRTIKALRG